MCLSPKKKDWSPASFFWNFQYKRESKSSLQLFLVNMEIRKSLYFESGVLTVRWTEFCSTLPPKKKKKKHRSLTETLTRPRRVSEGTCTGFPKWCTVRTWQNMDTNGTSYIQHGRRHFFSFVFCFCPPYIRQSQKARKNLPRCLSRMHKLTFYRLRQIKKLKKKVIITTIRRCNGLV